MKDRPYCVGLTGGIATGKTAVANTFAELGVAVIDTDQIARALTGPAGQALAAIRAAFGPEYFAASGELNRRALRERVFNDESARTRLEAILHPQILALAKAALEEAGGPYVILVVPLLLERPGYAERVDRVLLVDCDEATQITRCMARDGIEAPLAKRMLAAQMPRQHRLTRADDVLVNDSDLASLSRHVQRLHGRYLKMAAQPLPLQ